MTGATHGYNLRSNDKTKVEHCDRVTVFEWFDESSVVPSAPRLRPSTRHTKMDPSGNADIAELRAPHHKKATPPSAPSTLKHRKGMEGSQSWGLQGGSTASSDASGETRSGSCADVEAARLRVEWQRDRDARRIYYVQKAKRLRVEWWALLERAELVKREAEEAERLVERMKEGTLDDDSESELSEAETMVCDGDEDERASLGSGSYASTEVYSESEQQVWELMYQPQQEVALRR